MLRPPQRALLNGGGLPRARSAEGVQTGCATVSLATVAKMVGASTIGVPSGFPLGWSSIDSTTTADEASTSTTAEEESGPAVSRRARRPPKNPRAESDETAAAPVPVPWPADESARCRSRLLARAFRWRTRARVATASEAAATQMAPTVRAPKRKVSVCSGASPPSARELAPVFS